MSSPYGNYGSGYQSGPPYGGPTSPPPSVFDPYASAPPPSPADPYQQQSDPYQQQYWGTPAPSWSTQTGIPVAQPQRNGLVSLILGLVGILTPFTILASIPAIIFGVRARRIVRDGGQDDAGLGTAGLVLGIIVTALIVLVFVGVVLLLAGLDWNTVVQVDDPRDYV